MPHNLTQPLTFHAVVETPEGRPYVNAIPIAAVPNGSDGGRPAKAANLVVRSPTVLPLAALPGSDSALPALPGWARAQDQIPVHDWTYE